MNKLTDISAAFETLKEWMKQHRKSSDRLGMTYEEWEIRLDILCLSYGIAWPGEAEARRLFEQGLWPYAAFKKLETTKP